MKHQDNELTAYCGLFFGDCIRYTSKTSDLASQLLNELRKVKYENYVKVKQKNVKELGNYEAIVSGPGGHLQIKLRSHLQVGKRWVYTTGI